MSDLGLGIDAGGTETRWALADAAGAILAEGGVAGMSATQMNSDSGRQAVQRIFSELAAQVLAVGQPTHVCAGLTGFDSASTELGEILAAALKVTTSAIAMRNDIEIAYLDSFDPGGGYLVYAGTGSIAAWINESRQFHRAGGRGVALDDGGGGYWIAREALRHIWRAEDEQPGAWQQSAMARAVFEHIGGSEWWHTRQFVYGQDRGAIGQVAVAVAASVESDPVAREIIEQAGRELARIALALVRRFGARPIVLSGGASYLHPLIVSSMRAVLPAELSITQRPTQAHHAAAKIALHSYE